MIVKEYKNSLIKKLRSKNKQKRNLEDFYFRGEKKEWEMTQSSLLRHSPKETDPNYISFQRRILVLIQALDKLEPTKDRFISRMIYLRHLGVDTPLIDLTRSFEIALFFACLHSNSQETNGRVKVFERNSFPLIMENNFDKYFHENILSFRETKGVILDRTESLHPNIRKQEGLLLFTFQGELKDYEYVDILAKDKREIIKELKKKGICSETLFSGFEGVSTMLSLDNKHIKGEKFYLNERNEKKDNEGFLLKRLDLYTDHIYSLSKKNYPTYIDTDLALFTHFYNYYYYKKGKSDPTVYSLPSSTTLSAHEKVNLVLDLLHKEASAQDPDENILLLNMYLESLFKNSLLEQDNLDTILKFFNPKRILSIDNHLFSFKSQLTILLKIENWTPANQIKGKSENLKTLKKLLKEWWNFLSLSLNNIVIDNRRREFKLTMPLVEKTHNTILKAVEEESSDIKNIQAQFSLILWLFSIIYYHKSIDRLAKNTYQTLIHILENSKNKESDSLINEIRIRTFLHTNWVKNQETVVYIVKKCIQMMK